MQELIETLTASYIGRLLHGGQQRRQERCCKTKVPKRILTSSLQDLPAPGEQYSRVLATRAWLEEETVNVAEYLWRLW